MTPTQELKTILSKITDQVGLVDTYLQEVSLLEKKDTIFTVCDLDDTIFGRHKIRDNEPELTKHRGYAGNLVSINDLGIHNIVQKYYQGQSYPQDIIGKLSPETTVILTAGVPEYQLLKRRAIKLDHFPMRVVWEGKDKVLETIRYIIFELKYIPSEIIVYEDRPQFFVEYKELIEGVLGTKLTIMYIEMDGNDGYKKIEEI